jgi:cytoplasmic iron level regulating protein YaaA (DUF328/UPF0246 family)
METTDVYRKMIVDEINFAAKKMTKTQNASEKLYYFSAVFGVLQRIFNIEYDSDLVFSYSIIRATHDAFLNRLKAIQHGGDNTVSLSDNQFEKLTSLTKELAKKINKNEDVTDTLKKFAILAYSTSGNGFYLMQKGLLKI